jgi:hypothetical protein
MKKCNRLQLITITITPCLVMKPIKISPLLKGFNIRGLKELSNVSKHKFKSSYKDVIYQVYKENWGKQMLKHSEGKLCS